MSRSNSPKRRHGPTKLHNSRPICMPAKRKVRYRSRKIALTAMNVLIGHAAAGKARTAPSGVYECEHCGDWHLTSHPQA